MAARNIMEAFIISLAQPKMDNSIGELKDFFAHAHYRYINQLRKDGKPWEVADEAIVEFLSGIFEVKNGG